VIRNHVNGVEIQGIESVLFQRRAGKGALQRGKAKAIAAVPFEKKLDQTIAESANAIVENYGSGNSLRHNTSDRGE
jgi:hypothetical protein